MKKTLEFFIEKAKSVHGNKYDYIEADFKNLVSDIKNLISK